MLLALAFSAALMADAAAAAPPASAPAAPAAAPQAHAAMTYAPPKAADQKDNQLVCHSEAVLGSRLPVRRCRTVGDIKDRELQDRQAIERAQANIHIDSN